MMKRCISILLLDSFLLPSSIQGWVLPANSRRLGASPSSTKSSSFDNHHQQLSSRSILCAKKVAAESASAGVSPRSELKDEYDHIIIGSGIGGLTVASLLAQSTDDQVLLLEQHDRIGGCTHTFDRRGYSYGVGIHYIGDVQEGGNTKKCLDALTPATDPVVWDRLPDNYDSVIFLGNDCDNDKDASCQRYDIVANRQAEALKEKFPNEKDQAAIDEYFDLVRKACESFNQAVVFKMLPRPLVSFLLRQGWHRWIDAGYHKYASTTVQQVLESITNNPQLQSVLSYCWGDYGTIPSQAPFVMHALLMNHYASGAYYPQGGPKQIAQKILKVLESRNCDVRVRSPVRRILVQQDDGNKVSGVELQDGRQIRARKSVVSNAGYRNTFDRLLPKEHHARKIGSLNANGALRNGLSGLGLFVGLRGDHDLDWNLPRKNLWMFSENVNMNECVNNIPKKWQDVQPQDFAPVFVGAPSGKDSQWKKDRPDKSSLEIFTAAPWSWFEEYAPKNDDSSSSSGHVDPGGKTGSHGKEYEAAKEEIAQRLWSRARQGLVAVGASEKLPKNLTEVDFYELGSPLTFAHYLWSEGGAFYGLDHNTSRFDPSHFYMDLRPEVPHVPGLYLTGQDVASCGLAGAMVGGYMCASTILGVANPFGMIDQAQRYRVLEP